MLWKCLLTASVEMGPGQMQLTLQKALQVMTQTMLITYSLQKPHLRHRPFERTVGPACDVDPGCFQCANAV